MSKGRKRSRKVVPRSYYPLSEVNQKIDNGQFVIRPNAAERAFDDFGWEGHDIIKAYKMLLPRHFYKTDSAIAKPGFVIDIYKAHIMGEYIYTHFYIDDNNKELVINSFHQV